MANSKRKAFTLIELIGVLVIMAILALIATPLVMNIIRKARISADKRSIDAYGRSIELAVAGYLLDTGRFPTSVDQLTIEYSGNEVVCTTTQLNSDSSVYLDGCTVAGRSVDYHYGENKNTTPEPVTPSYTAYQVGDHVSYNGVTYYVIEDSDTTNNTVKLLKEAILTKEEMDALALEDVTISSVNSYGVVAYGETTDYATSTIKKVVDAWKNTAVKSGDSAVARLITFDEIHSLGYGDNLQEAYRPGSGVWYYPKTDDVPNWVYTVNDDAYDDAYYTSGEYGVDQIWTCFSSGGTLGGSGLGGRNVRPVIELNKSADITKLAS